MAYRGKYRVKNTAKYKGDPTKVVYRSGLELKTMNYLDAHPDVLEWSSEEVIVPYRCKTDNKMHRYFVDFYYKAKLKDGTTKTYLVEVKPYLQTLEPVKKTRKTRRYLNEVLTWAKNQSKWEAAEEYCADRGWSFIKLTEKEINSL